MPALTHDVTPCGLISDQWLSTLLHDMGTWHEEVAETLRKQQIRGRRTMTDCPVARYVASRVREQAPTEPVKVIVAGGGVIVQVGEPSVDGSGRFSAPLPEPVGEFISAFDNAEYDHDLYADLRSDLTN
ncbi:hypothetical protein [Actinomadura miaoliensis]|uniref:Uncharacterized protein n=1 Tax=Actinomadura miaoliensis TaxID=430685 RepID=A0ABP7X024_9ACTN